MARKKADGPLPIPSDVPDVNLDLEEIFNSLEGRMEWADRHDTAKILHQIKEASSSLMAKVLGSYYDYELLYEVEKYRNNRFQIYVKNAVLKEPRDQDTRRVCKAIELLLDQYSVSAEAAVDVFRSVEITIDQCWIRYKCEPLSGKITYVSPRDFGGQLFGEKVERYLPLPARAAKSYLTTTAKSWLMRKAKSDIQHLNFADQIAEIKRRLLKLDDTPSFSTPINVVFSADYYKSLLSRIKDQLEAELDIEKRCRADLKEIKSVAEPIQEARARKLASICALFREATPDTQRKVWDKLKGLTRPQWALFLIEVNPNKKGYGSKAAAFDALIKPNAQIIEAICERTNIRGVRFDEKSKRYLKDKEKVAGIIRLLRADLINRTSV